MATRIRLGEAIQLPTASLPTGFKAGNLSALAEVSKYALRSTARKYALVVAYGCVSCIGMIAWVYFLGLALLKAVEWTLG